MRLKHICEVCGVEEELMPEEAYEAGWDYPPTMVAFGVLSPRTCPHCPMTGTVWWAMAVEKKDASELTADQRTVLARISNEPASIMVPDHLKEDL